MIDVLLTLTQENWIKLDQLVLSENEWSDDLVDRAISFYAASKQAAKII